MFNLSALICGWREYVHTFKKWNYICHNIRHKKKKNKFIYNDRGPNGRGKARLSLLVLYVYLIIFMISVIHMLISLAVLFLFFVSITLFSFDCVYPCCLSGHYVVAEVECNWYLLGINIQKSRLNLCSIASIIVHEAGDQPWARWGMMRCDMTSSYADLSTDPSLF